MFFRTRGANRARAAASAPARSTIPSLLGSDLTITGDVSSSGEVQVDGRVEGDVIADRLVVSEAGGVDGAIAANSVRILGVVNGPITAGCVRLGRTARVTGDIVHQTLCVEEGAFVTGHCRRSEAEGCTGMDGEDEAAVDGAMAALATEDQDPSGRP